MRKLKVAVAACGLVMGLTGAANAALSPSTNYAFTGTVLDSYGYTNVSNGDAFKAIITTNSLSEITRILLLDTKNPNTPIILSDINNLDNSYITYSKATATTFKLTYEKPDVETYNITYNIGTNTGFNFEANDQYAYGVDANLRTYSATPTPIPAAAWLLGSGLLGMVGLKRRKTTAA